MRGRDGWDFKQYVLGTLFYRFISENFADHFNDENTNYAELSDDIITDEIKVDTVKTKGYLFTQVSYFAMSSKMPRSMKI